MWPRLPMEVRLGGLAPIVHHNCQNLSIAAILLAIVAVKAKNSLKEK